MIDADKLRDKLRELEEAKDKVIQLGIKINRYSKSMIYSLIKNDLEKAKKYMKEMEEMVKELKDTVTKYPMYHNHAQQSLQEYVEALTMWYYITEDRIPTQEEINIDTIPYLNGIMDFAGELSRKATEEMIKGNLDFALKTKKLLEELYLDLLSLEPRDYEIRKKVDYVASTLNWLNEKIFYKTLRINDQP